MSSSLSNSKIKTIKSLTQKKFRDSLGLFTVEGDKMVSEAIESGFEIEEVFRVDEIGSESMSRISSLVSSPPSLAVVRKPSSVCLRSKDEVRGQLCGNGLFLALDTISDPGNLGTILRIADWFGIDGVFASESTVDLFNPKVVQSTMGAIFRVSFHYASLKDLCTCVKELSGNVYGTFLDGENIYSHQLDGGRHSPSVIVIGNESEGISDEIASMVTDRLFIPSFPSGRHGSESLNAAVATAITVAEFRRR